MSDDIYTMVINKKYYQPTTNLRFVYRENLKPPAPYFKERVLQQLWTDGYGNNEWRDIPLVSLVDL